MSKRLFILALALAACAVPRAAAVETLTATPPTAGPPATAVLTITPLPPLPPGEGLGVRAPTAPTQSFAPDCTATKGTITNHNHHSKTLGYSLFYDIYLPPCYEATGDSYPVLYLLHGKAFVEDQWERLGADEAADELIAAAEVPPFIIVMPRGGANAYFGQGLIKDLLPYVETTYRIRRDRADRAIGGLSRGAGWAIYLGLSRPDLFGAIGVHSPAIQYTHAPEVDNLLDALSPDEIPRMWIDIGEDDSLIGNTQWFMAMLDERGIPYAFHTYPGKHDETYWSARVREYIFFYAEAWQ